MSFQFIFLNFFCVAGCKAPPSGVNTKAVPDIIYKLGEGYNYTCLTDYVPFYTFKDGNETHCMENGEWSLNPPMSCTSKSVNTFNMYII